MPEYVGNWTTMLAYCTFCKAVYQNMNDAAKHEERVHGRVTEPLAKDPSIKHWHGRPKDCTCDTCRGVV